MAARGTRASRRSPLAHPDTYNGSPDRPHGLAVRTPAFHAGDRRFESGWGYCRTTSNRALSDFLDFLQANRLGRLLLMFPSCVPGVLNDAVRMRSAGTRYSRPASLGRRPREPRGKDRGPKGTGVFITTPRGTPGKDDDAGT